MISTIKTFLQRETAAGIILFFAAVLAVIFANTPLNYLYEALFSTKFTLAGIVLGMFILLEAKDGSSPEYAVDDRLGIIIGSGLSAVCGYLVLRFSTSPDMDSSNSY